MIPDNIPKKTYQLSLTDVHGTLISKWVIGPNPSSDYGYPVNEFLLDDINYEIMKDKDR